MINIYANPEKTVHALAQFILELANSKPGDNKKFTVALSGGNTPKLLFEAIKNEYAGKTEWKNIHIFWGDERCVNPDSPESNYGTAKTIFLQAIDIPLVNIHRIKGEENPGLEAERYSKEIFASVNLNNGYPSFDLIILGLGNDGHTASIFPDQMDLLASEKICDVAIHPVSGQNRITITGKVINNAKNIVFLVTGNEKADIVSKIINKKDNYNSFPAAYVNPEFGNLTYFLDEESAKKI